MEGRNQIKKTVVFDVETSGLSLRAGHRIIEIGAVALKGREIIGEFNSLINPGRALDSRAVAIHGITGEMLGGKPDPNEIFPLFRRFLGDARLVAHNARFDVGFLGAEFERIGLSLTNKVFCTLSLSRRFYPKLPNHRLETVYRHLCGEISDTTRRHRALDDARLTMEVWLALERK